VQKLFKNLPRHKNTRKPKTTRTRGLHTVGAFLKNSTIKTLPYNHETCQAIAFHLDGGVVNGFEL